MKKILFAILVFLVIGALAACAGKKEQAAETDGGEAAASQDVDFGAIMSGNGGAELLSGYTAAQKAAIVAEGKKNGVDITFNADGSTTFQDENGEYTQNPDGTWTMTSGDGGVSQVGGSWPDNEFTRLIPQPEFPLLAASSDGSVFTAIFSNTGVDEVKAYTEKVKAAGFTVDAVTEEGKLSGLDSFYYSALNADGYTVQIYVGDGASGINVLKP